MKRTLLLTILSLMMTCDAFAFGSAFAANDSKALLDAQKHFKAGETYQAKKNAGIYLQKNPSSLEGQKLMAQIIDHEIAQQKEVFETEAPEDLNKDQKALGVKTWLERSKGFLQAGEYDEAALAAENVFQFDPQNREASMLLDQIRGSAWKDGKKEVLSRNQNIIEEMSDRSVIYKKQARAWMAEGKPGAARLAIQKLLLLSPEDKEALKLYEELKRNEIRKTMAASQTAASKEPDEARETL